MTGRRQDDRADGQRRPPWRYGTGSLRRTLNLGGGRTLKRRAITRGSYREVPLTVTQPLRVSVSGPLRDTGRLAEGPPGADADAGTFAPLLGWSLERKL
jgi:hypothetical protein